MFYLFFCNLFKAEQYYFHDWQILFLLFFIHLVLFTVKKRMYERFKAILMSRVGQGNWVWLNVNLGSETLLSRTLVAKLTFTKSKQWFTGLTCEGFSNILAKCQVYFTTIYVLSTFYKIMFYHASFPCYSSSISSPLHPSYSSISYAVTIVIYCYT